MAQQSHIVDSVDNSRRHIKAAAPFPPWIPPFEPGPDAFIKIREDARNLPLLIQKKSWTKCVPQKHFYKYCKPSEQIASNRTPQLLGKHLSTLRRRNVPRKLRDDMNPLGPDGRLRYPPIWTAKKQRDEDLKRAEQIRQDNATPGIIGLKDLLSGEYDRRKRAERERNAMKRKLLQEKNARDDVIKKKKEIQHLASLSAEEPMELEKQIDILRKMSWEHATKFEEIELARIAFYMFEGIKSEMIIEYPTVYLKRALDQLNSKFFRLPKCSQILQTCKTEIVDGFDRSMRFIILSYILCDKSEQVRLKIPGLPPGPRPVYLLRAPVPWETSMKCAYHRMSHMLFKNHPVTTKIDKLWHMKYKKMLVIKWERLSELKPLPLAADELTNRVEQLCNECRNILEDEWLPLCADVFLEFRDTWEHLVPRNRDGSLANVRALFSAVHAAMSNHVRDLIMRSLDHFVGRLEIYRTDNTFKKYQDYLFILRPLVIIKAFSSTSRGYLCAKPTLLQLCDLIHQILVNIVNVNKNLPRVECYLFPEMRNTNFFIHPVGIGEEVVDALVQRASAVMNANILGPSCYLVPIYKEFTYILNSKMYLDMIKFLNTEPRPYLKDFTKLITTFENVIDTLGSLRQTVPLNMICLDLRKLNETLSQAVRSCRSYIIEFFMNENRIKNREICDTFESMSDHAGVSAETTEEIVNLSTFLAECRDVTMYALKEQIRTAAERVLFLMQHAHLQIEDIQLNSRVFLWPNDMESVLELSGARLSHRREQCEVALKVRRQEFLKHLEVHKRDVDLFRKRDPALLNMEELLESTRLCDELVHKLDKDKIEADILNREETLLDYEPSPFLVLHQLLAAIEPFSKLWHTSLDFHQKYDTWYYGSFMELDAAAIKDEVETMWRTLYKLGKALQDAPGARRIADLVRTKVERFRQFIPVLECICNPGMLDRHWEQVTDALGEEVKPTTETSLHDLIEIGIPKIIEQLEEISNSASKEFSLQMSLDKMKEEWQDVKFVCVQYRDTGCFILTALEDIQTLLDDHILKSQAMRGSPFIKALKEAAQAWEEKLVEMQDILDAWLTCQATWMYLESIFSSEDIMRQMPGEARNFRLVDKRWRQLMDSTVANPQVITATDYPNLLHSLREHNQTLEGIQKGLNDYLEKKRLYFPRFFFLANDELLEILSETKDPLRVQPHLKKCFEGVHSLVFNGEMEVEGIVSAHGEVVALSCSVIPADSKGLVERWLLQLENQIIISLRGIMTLAVSDYGISHRAQWILKWPGQIVQTGDCITWTMESTDALKRDKLLAYKILMSEQIVELVKLVNGVGSINHQITMEALIVLNIHARDIIRLLIDKKITSTNDFQWLSQLRYYLCSNSDVDTMMLSTTVKYGFEYLGNTGRLVATPLTDRCYRTIMGAIKLFLGGAPEGPSGSGKTETCKDLAKAVAKKCVVFNCSEGLDHKALGKLFKGLAQSGAWSCFDEFNRIELEVLSVVAQQILCIQRAACSGQERFVFEGIEIPLDPTCTVFITMNPGYAGRQKLPENLKILFRPVAMMDPDYAMIGEITLYSNGFMDSHKLALKISHAYKLCSEQLSSQNHYDFGMRAVKSVLRTAGTLRRMYPDLEESQLVLRSIIDVSLPKLLTQDILLFEGICLDLFPGVKLPETERADLLGFLTDVFQSKNLKNTDWFRQKGLQLYEMIQFRHGLMIVGESFGGKTCAYQSLAASLKELQMATNNCKMKESQVVYRIINPKAITMGQLYGCFDPVTHEWTDGVLANTFREYAVSLTPDRKWIVLDGPVDAGWIESMNTVLDDNKKLCLMSGEIIQMNHKMNLIFETVNLEQASPATVSRCGIIFFEPKMLGWHAFKYSFNVRIEKIIIPEQFEIVNDMMEWLIPPILTFVFKTNRLVNTSELHLFCTFGRLMYSLLEAETQVSTIWLQCAMLFCLIWGFGSTLTADNRTLFDVYFRRLVVGQDDGNPKPKTYKLTKAQIFPERGTIFDYNLDPKAATWSTWMDSNAPALPPTAKVSELMVPTNESACAEYFINLNITKKIPFVIVGPTGTGKSAVLLNYMLGLPKEKWMPLVINFSARSSANQTQDLVMSKLDRRRKGVYGPTLGKQCVLFVDDLGMPQRETHGAQAPLELLRTFIDHGNWSDLRDTSRIDLIDILFCSAVGVPGGSNYVDGRLMRHLSIIGVASFEDATISRIFTAIIDWHFAKGFTEAVSRFSQLIVKATTVVYRAAMATFLPTPAKCHYRFSLRDFSRVVRGILLVPAKCMEDTDKLIRLWAHETYRVFYDRLMDDVDREEMFNIIHKATYTGFRQNLDKIAANLLPGDEKVLKDRHIRDLFFGNYMHPDADPKIYDEVTDLEDLTNKMVFYLDEYNALSNTPMNVVLFRFAIEHVSRVSRALQVPDGHCLLVGIGGSGRRTAVKLATSIADGALFQIDISRNYGFDEWRDDMKKLILKSGFDEKPTVFLFSGNQVKDEMFVEDINTLLNTADLPNLFQSEEKTEILEKMTTAARIAGHAIETTPLALYGYFIERVKNALHICLTMSLIGNAFRKRIQMYPSLINCCTLDWFMAWPEDALERVALNFVTPMQLGDFVTDASIKLCRLFHTSVDEASEKMWYEMGRRNYVTPTSYLEFIKSFQNLYNFKVDQIVKGRDRYVIGLHKLDSAAGQVTVMQAELQSLQPQLIDTSDKTEKLMVKIEQDTVAVEAQKEIVGADEALANEAAAAAQAIKDDCESDLQEAIPALQQALSALDTLKPADITIVKSMKNPPVGVKLVMEAICVMKGVKPEKKPDPSGSGNILDDYWGPSLKVLGDMKFLESLKTYNKDAIPTAAMKRIREKFITDRDFEPDVIKNISTACEGLCRWVRAMDVYDRVIKIVAPKKASLLVAETDLAAQMDILNQKRAQLQGVMGKLQALNDEFAEYSRKKKGLEDDIALCEQKLDRAEKLIGGLGGEKSRWSETAASLNASLHNVTGDALMSAGTVTYLGPFMVQTRTQLVTMWNEKCIDLNIPCSEHFSLLETLGNASSVRAWGLAGLPADAFSIDNGIIVSYVQRWPLMIDPQGQANKWIKNLEKDNGLCVIKLTDENYLKVVENSIQVGVPVLLENIGEEIDAALTPVLERNVFIQRGAVFLKLQENLIEYSKNFKFYITTNLRNPHYLPETAVMVTLLNFMITQEGLKEQLLGTVVARERPDLQEKKTQLVLESVKNKDTLQNIEEQILHVLSTSEGNILEDESALKILTSSKILSEEILAKQDIAAVTEKEIDEECYLYVPVPTHSAVLFFCLTELTKIDPMYQYSLSWFLSLFNSSMMNADASDVLEVRLKNLNDHFTYSIYKNVCRSLFQKHKLTFSMVLCVGILRSQGLIREDLLSFFLMGGVALDYTHPNPAPEWLPEKAWSEIVTSSLLAGLEAYEDSVTNRTSEWYDYYNLSNPEDTSFPAPLGPLQGLEKLVVLRCIRPDKVCPAVEDFIVDQLGVAFVESPVFDLAESYADSTPWTPLIFILSAGCDPMAAILKFTSDMSMSMEMCQTISLGQGQGPIASAMIKNGMEEGHWVVLQNCHLAESWMQELDRLCNEVVVPANCHEKFRLWLTSCPSKVFPVSILQNGVKMTTETPKGLRLNMLRSYMMDPICNEEFFNSCPLVNPWQRLLFGVVFFHGLVQERRQYGPLGWNIPYEFNDSDLKISVTQLQLFLTDYEDVPYDAIHYLTGECNYGGRVTDDKDRRLLNSLLDVVNNKETVEIQGYPFSPSGTYHVPLDTSIEGSIAYIKSLPVVPQPEVFGLNENADFTKNNQETAELLLGVLATQTHLTTNRVGSEDISIEHLVEDILKCIPSQFDLETVLPKYPIIYNSSMNTVLRQELGRFNCLLAVIQHTLSDVIRAVKGCLALVGELEEVHSCLLIGRVPKVWAAKSYLSLKPLGSYINDLIARIQFFQDWIDNGPPNVFWLSGFFFTQSFVTGVLQNYSRGNKLPIDLISVDFYVTSYESDSKHKPAFDCYVKELQQAEVFSVFFDGLYLEGARWDRDASVLGESLPKILFDSVPIMWLRPSSSRDKDGLLYQCPIYKTTARRGTVSTTGHSTNFVMYTEFKTSQDKSQAHWINRGVACICQLDD